MASYHFSAQIIQRSKGRSAIAAAAYRAGARLHDESGRVHDYSKRRGVVYSTILVPDGAAPMLGDRQRLWAHAEGMERRADAQLAREINLALPCELDAVQRKETLLNFVQEAFVSRGMVADVCIHEPVVGKNSSPDNHHAHIMLPLRRATRGGLHPVKTREWNARELLNEWRASWAEHQNRALSRAGLSVKVDHRTLVAQRAVALQRGHRAEAALLDRRPEVHLGRRAMHALRPLASKMRLAGPKRKREGEAKPVRRAIAYPQIDRGSRRAFRAARMDAQRVRLKAKVQTWQVRAARMRLRKVKARREELRLQFDIGRLLASLPRRPDARGQWERALAELTRQLAARQRRRALFERMLNELDRALPKLLAARPVAMGRVVSRGRVRARHPSAFATTRPDSAGPSAPE